MSHSSDQDRAPKPIAEIAAQLGLDETSVEPYGWYAGKLSLGLHERLTDRPTGKYVGVTAINPTPFGEGKTVVSIGLAMALIRRRQRSIVALREPSLAPVFGIKGGGAGGGRACAGASSFQNLYALDLPYEQKITKLAIQTYGADGVDFQDGVVEKLSEFARGGYGNLPVCIAKTQYSLSHDPKKLGRTTGFRLPIREVRLSAGAGFVLVVTDGISLMPGLPREPAARRIDVDRDGRIAGL